MNKTLPVLVDSPPSQAPPSFGRHSVVTSSQPDKPPPSLPRPPHTPPGGRFAHAQPRRLPAHQDARAARAAAADGISQPPRSHGLRGCRPPALRGVPGCRV
eukprot:134503-Chlamydomonas_euryale.AAC.2